MVGGRDAGNMSLKSAGNFQKFISNETIIINFGFERMNFEWLTICGDAIVYSFIRWIMLVVWFM